VEAPSEPNVPTDPPPPDVRIVVGLRTFRSFESLPEPEMLLGTGRERGPGALSGRLQELSPVVSTAFRPVDADELARNPFRVFTSMLVSNDPRFFDNATQDRRKIVQVTRWSRWGLLHVYSLADDVIFTAPERAWCRPVFPAVPSGLTADARDPAHVSPGAALGE
jgi:uncharacterized glyoxalase superfamily metalloenzyme YdcJ